MGVFGDTEVATRTLSNIYIAIASVVLYRLVYLQKGYQTAIAALVLFSLTSTAVKYSYETRSYAQTILFVTISSLGLYKVINRDVMEQAARKYFRGIWPFILFSANTGLVLTHYYNIFMLVGQGIFFWTFLIIRRGGRIDLWGDVSRLAYAYVAPVAMLVVIWFPALLRSLNSLPERFEVTSEQSWPLYRVIYDMTLRLTLTAPFASSVILLVVIFFYFALRWVVRRSRELSNERAIFDFYYVVWFLAPCAVAWVAFQFASKERYEARYFVASIPALSILLTLAFRQIVGFATAGSYRMRRLAVQWSLPLVSLYAFVVLVPVTLQTVNIEKADWRGLATRIAAMARNEPNRQFVLYESNFAAGSVINYYFGRVFTNLRVTHFITPKNEQMEKYPFEDDKKKMKGGERIVLIFPHRSVKEYQKTVSAAARSFTEVARILDRRGFGFILYDNTPPAQPPAGSAVNSQ